MTRWWKIAFGFLSGLLTAGLILLISERPRGEAIPLLPAPTPLPILVHVAGAVVQPGLYTLQPGSRVQDAVQAAGGLMPEADLRAVNLAATLTDGERILIPTTPPTSPPSSSQIPGTNSRLPDVLYPININTATQAELESLPGIGPITAQKIIQYREQNGPFKKIEDLLNVPGIGLKTLDEIKPYITV